MKFKPGFQYLLNVFKINDYQNHSSFILLKINYWFKKEYFFYIIIIFLELEVRKFDLVIFIPFSYLDVKVMA